MGGLIDERVATRVAARLSSQSPLDGSYLLEGLDEQLAALVGQAEPMIKAETGFAFPPGAKAVVMSRSQWASANVAPMLQLMGPLLEKAEEKMKRAPVSPLASLAYGPMLGAQIGAVLAFLSQRVLGQYDLIGHAGEVWFVGPNLVLTERRFGFVPRDFRLWVAVHELTHRAQFTGNPWMQRYFHEQVGGLLEVMDFDASRALRRLADGMRTPGRDGGLMIGLLEPEQLERFNKLQAFMSVIEGHANFVMDRVAESHIPTQPRMRATLKSGATAGGVVAKLLSKLLGLDLKKAQYRQGQDFFEALQKEAGAGAVAACFESAENLPSMDEIRDPQSWLLRLRP